MNALFVEKVLLKIVTESDILEFIQAISHSNVKVVNTNAVEKIILNNTNYYIVV